MRKLLMAACLAGVIFAGGCLAYLDNHPICGITEEDSAAMGAMIQRLEREKEERENKLMDMREFVDLERRIGKMCRLSHGEAHKLAAEVIEASRRFDIPSNLLCAIMVVESHGRRQAKNGSCVGLMQVSAPIWRRELRSAGICDVHSVEAGAYVLSTYLRETHGNVQLALYKYSGGGGNRYAAKVRNAGGEW